MSRAVLCIAVVWMTFPVLAAAQQPPGSPQPLPTRKSVLAIPFRIGETTVQKHKPVEVQLFVSSNGGASWNHAGTVKPDVRKIVYRAPRDGEYWFCVRTKDASGNTRPAGPMTPELRVLVDTAAPQLRVDAWRGVDGETTVRWDAEDKNLHPQSLTIEYRPHGSQKDSWQPAPVQAGRPATGPNAADRVTWKAAGPVEVRVKIADLAGNVAEQIASTGVPAKQAEPQPNLPPALPWDITPPARSTPWPTDLPKAPPIAPARDARPWGPNRQQPAAAGGAIPYPIEPLPPSETNGNAKPDVARLPPVSDAAASPERPDGLRNAEALTFNSAELAVAYNFGSVPPHDLRAVELWATPDGGKTWRRAAVDTDRMSPIVGRFEDEGLYGLRVLFQRENGPVEFPPREGDSPETWVEVDRTAPQCHLTTVDELVAPGKYELRISWKASDRNLADRPVTLLYRHHPRSPWRVIAAGLANTGSYVWPLGNLPPENIYFRLEVRDKADNVGEFSGEQPVTPRAPRKQGRVHGVAPHVPAPANLSRRPHARMYYFR